MLHSVIWGFWDNPDLYSLFDLRNFPVTGVQHLHHLNLVTSESPSCEKKEKVFTLSSSICFILQKFTNLIQDYPDPVWLYFSSSELFINEHSKLFSLKGDNLEGKVLISMQFHRWSSLQSFNTQVF